MILLFIIFIVISVSGCLEQDRIVTTDVQSFYKFTDLENTTETKFLNENKNAIIEGKIINIIFGKNQNDVLLFEDGVVKNCYYAENFIWKIGEIHRITFYYDWFNQNDNQIIKVEILNN